MRYLLALLIFFLATVDVFGWPLSLGPGLSAKNALLYLILLVLAMRFALRGGLRLELRRVFVWYGILISYAVLTWLIAGVLIQYKSYELIQGAIDLKTGLLDNLLLFVLYLYGIRTTRDAEFLLKCILFAVAAANVIAIGNVAGLYAIGVTPVGNEGNIMSRVFGAFGHANETAALIVCLLPAYLAATLSSRGFVRIGWALGGAASGGLLVLTGSRSGFVALAASIVIGTYLCRHMLSWRRAAVISIPIAVIGAVVLTLVTIKFGDVLTQRVLQLILSPGTSSEDRTYIWMPIISMMAANPVTLLTGFGWDVYSVMGFRYAAHNEYLFLWFELGIVGLVAWVMLMTQLVSTARRAAKIAHHDVQRYLIAFVYGMTGVLVAVASGLLFHPWLYIWIYCGISMRMAVNVMRSEQLETQSAENAATPAKPKSRRPRASTRLPVMHRGR